MADKRIDELPVKTTITGSDLLLIEDAATSQYYRSTITTTALQGPAGVKGDIGIQGLTGPKGDTGATGASGTNGTNGAAASVAVGPTTTGAAGTNASVVNTGTTSAAVLAFTVPQGATGPQGPQGPTGTAGTPATSTALGAVQLAGDLSGTANAPTLATILTAGSTGSTTATSAITYDAKGRITAATSTPIQIAESQVNNLTTDLSTINANITTNTSNIALKAPLVSPALTGTPTTPTAANGTNTTQIASTAFVLANTPTVNSATTTTAGIVKQTVYNVRDYGAVGDGTTNDSTAIQSAINAANTAGGGIVFFPAGTFAISSTVGGSTAGQYSNIAFKGVGRNVSVIKALTGMVMVNFGNGDPISGNTWSNLHFADITFDMNNQSANGFCMTLGSCLDVTIENAQFKNAGAGAHAFLFFGVSTNATSAMVSRNLTVRNTVFSNSSAGWEGVTLSQAYNVKIVNCTFRDKANGFMLLNYGSHDVSVTNCQFISCAMGLNGFGATEITGCNFSNGSITNQAFNTTITNCSWDGTLTTGNGINILGYTQAAGESFWDALPANTQVTIRNTKIAYCSFRNANTASIKADRFTGNDSNLYLSAYDLEIVGCSFELTKWQGIDVKAKERLTIRDCTAYNSGQLGTAAVAYNYVFAGKKVLFDNNYSYDDQTTRTVNTDFFIDNQLSATLLPTQDIVLTNNKFTISTDSSLPRYYTGTTFTSVQPSNIIVKGSNNDLINSDATYNQGNVNGATVFSRYNGALILATLTGNITVTIPSGAIANDNLTLALTQDATGNRTITLPSNVKTALGGLTLSTTAGATDIISLVWDGSSWRETGRALGTAGTQSDATTTSKGVVQLAGDLAGTAAAPTVPGLATKATDSAVVHLAGSETVTGVKTFNAGTLLDKGNQVFSVKAYGLKGDSITSNDAITTVGSAVVSSASASFTVADVNKNISINNASANASLTTALVSGTVYTSLAVTAITTAIASGASIILGYGTTTQTLVTSAAVAAGAVSIPVTSFTANAAYNVGSPIGATQLTTTIASVQSATQLTLSVNAQATTSASSYNYATDDGPALTSLINTVCSAGGGTIAFDNKTYLIKSVITFPLGGTANKPTQPPIRMIGKGASFNGYWSASTVNGGTVLDLRYAGTDNLYQAKIDTRGAGTLEIEHLTLKSGGNDNFLMMYTSNTTCFIHHNSIIGNAANSGLSCQQDFISMGGSSGSIGSGANAAFQGYGTKLTDNFYDHIRTGTIIGTYANSVVIDNETFSQTCGSNDLTYGAPYMFPANNLPGFSADQISNAIIEATYYAYGITVLAANSYNIFTHNAVWDDIGNTKGGIYLESGGGQNIIIAGLTNLTNGVKYVTGPGAYGTNTIISAQAGVQSRFPGGINANNDGLLIGNDPANPQLILSSGKLGIGTPTANPPSSFLTIEPSSDTGGQLSFRNHTSHTDKYAVNLANLGADFNLAQSGVIDGRLYLKSDGATGIYLATPTARLHVGAGNATMAPLKINIGTKLTTPEAGAIENDGTHLYYTAGTTRYQLDQQAGGSATQITRTVPTVINDTVEIGQITLNNGTGIIEVAITVASTGFGVAKHYSITNYFAMASSYKTVQPITTTGIYNGNDFNLELLQGGNVCTLRIRRTAGSTAGTAYINVTPKGVAADVFSPTTVTASGTAAPTTSIVSENYVDLTETQTIGGTKTFSLAPTVPTPVNPTDASNKQYVDSVATGLDVKASVRLASNSNHSLTAPGTIDSVTLATGDRVLLKNQTTTSENGIYTYNGSALVRSTDTDSSAEVTSGMFTFVSEGTLNAGKGFVLSTIDPIVLNTTGLVFSQFSSVGTTPDATTTTKGIVQLAGDLSGTSSAPTVPGLATKAADSAVVHLTGAETIAGVKTFSSTIAGSISGNAATVTTNANLTGDVTSTGNATTLATANANVGTFTLATVTVDAKGRVTAASTGTAGSSGITRSINNISTATTAAAVANTDYVYNMTGNTTLTMPTANGNTNRYTVKNNDAATTVTVAAAASQTVEGATTLTLSPGASIDLMATSLTNFGVY